MDSGFRRTSNIDERIDDLRGKQPTPDNLNLLGDLYLKKGNKRAAIECFLKSGDHAQRDKAIAIYKKIVKISPNEIRAYEGLIESFAQIGLVAEEIKYLLALAHVHKARGDAAKETAIFRRIYELDQTNRAAQLFFGRGKTGGTDEALTQGIPETASRGVAEDIPEEPYAPYEKEKRRLSDIVLFFSRWKEAVRSSDAVLFFRRWMKPLALSLVGLALVVAMVGTVRYFVERRGGEREGEISSPSVGSEATDERWNRNTRVVLVGGFEIEVTRLTDELIKMSAFGSRLQQEELRANHFYVVELKAGKNCVREELLMSPESHVSILNGGGVIPPEKTRAIARLSKVVYKENACGTGSGIVYGRLCIAYPRGTISHGISVDGTKIVFEKKSG